MSTQAPVTIDEPGRVYRRLLGYARPHMGMFAIGVLGMALFAATDSALAYLVKVFLGGTFVDGDRRVLWLVPLGAIVLFTLRGIGDYVSNYFPGWVGRQIIKALRGHTTGYATPIFVIDAPGGGGKIQLAPDPVAGRDGDFLLLRNFEGEVYRYPDPNGSLGR